MELLLNLCHHAKNERGYSGTSRLLTRLLHNVGEVYTVDERFVNKTEWDSPGKAKVHLRKYQPLLLQNSLGTISSIGENCIKPKILRSAGTVCAFCFGMFSPQCSHTFFYLVPTDEEIAFVLEILEKIGASSLDLLESLLPSIQSWDGIAKNDFCRCDVVSLLKHKP
jgi:proteasome activator subunit 4